jgi:hypothetical protein
VCADPLRTPARAPCYPIENVAVALLLCPRSVHVTVPVPPLPFDSICHDRPTLPLAPMVCAEPLNDTGALPLEYSTLAVQPAPGKQYRHSATGTSYITRNLGPRLHEPISFLPHR